MEEASVESLRQAAANWSLAGDHQLLNILQNTHQRLITKCKEVTDQLDSMVSSLDDASISLQNVNNRFMALSNSQFIESRVFDDDIDVATEPSTGKEQPKPPSALELNLESLKRGLHVLEDAHESLTILHDSDTDTDSEEEGAARTVLRPKDMYSERPLPHIIGTHAWKTKWHAGLVCSDSDSEGGSSVRGRSRSEYSDSEPESPPDPARVRPPQDTADITISETSSERLSIRDETPPPPATVKQSPADVAAELARRLGGQPTRIVQQTVDYEPPLPTTNKVYRPEQPTTGTVFSDEPPPLNYSSDSQDEDIFAGLHKSQPYAPSQTAPDLFGGGESPHDEGGDIFSDIAKPMSDPRPNYVKKPMVFPNEPHSVQTTDTVDDSAGIKKPAGAISLFGTNKGAETIGAAILKRNRKTSTSSDESVSNPPETPHTIVPTKEKDIFDDLFAKSQKINKEIVKDVGKDARVVPKAEAVVKDRVDLFSDNIFDDIDDIFTTNVIVKVPEKSQKSIFDDDDELFSAVAAPAPVRPDAKTDVTNKSLFESDDDDLFNIKSKGISRDAAGDSAKINAHKEVIGQTIEITKDIRSTSTKNSAKITKPVAKQAETTANVGKTSDIFDDDDDGGEDMFSNAKSNNRIQSTIISNIDNSSKSGNTFKSPSLFDDDDDDDLFTQTAKPSKQTPKDTAIGDQGTTGDIFDDTKDDIIFARATDSGNLTQKDAASVVTDLQIDNDNTTLTNESIESSDHKYVVVKPNIPIKNTGNNKSASDVNTNYTINSDVTKSVLVSNGSDDDDFEQDFDDLPPTSENRSVVNHLQTNVVAETKSNDIFDDTDDIFAKRPSTENNKNNVNSTIDKPVFKDTNQSPTKLVDNTEIKEADSETTSNVAEKSNIKTDSLKDLLVTTKIDDIPEIVDETHTKPNKDEDNLFKSPENTSKNTKMDDNNSIFKNTDTKTSVFDDIFTEPPVFEKPKEPKKSKNINALFDDDSDDETLFFKKNDAITDVKPDDFTLNRDRFDIFIDEPPDVDLEAKIDSDDELFSSLPAVPVIGDESSDKNKLNNAEMEYDKAEDTVGPLRNILDVINVSDDDLFMVRPKPPVPETENKVLDKNKNTGIDNVNLNASKNTQNQSKNVVDDVEIAKSNSDDDLFKITPKPPRKPAVTEMDSDEDLFRLPKANKPITAPPTNDKPAAIKKSDELTDQSDDLFNKLKDTPTSQPVIETKGDSDKELFKQRPNNEITVPHNATIGQKNLERDAEESPKKVGKLKSMNFNINVEALRPGASPKKQKNDPTSPTEPQKPYSKTQIHVVESNTNVDKTDSNDKVDAQIIKSVSFDDDAESGILDNKLSKERAKIQVKRRPSTRRARREAVRKSGIDFGEDSTDNSSSIDDPPRTHRRTVEHEPETDKNLDINKHNTKILDLVKDAVSVNEINEKPSPVITRTDDKNISKTDNQRQTATKAGSRDVNTKIVYILNDEDIFNTPAGTHSGVNTIGKVYGEKSFNSSSATDLKFTDTKSTVKSGNEAAISSNMKSGVTKSTNIEIDSATSKASGVNNIEAPSSSSLKSGVTRSTISEVDSVKKGIFDSDSDGELFTVRREVKKVVKGPLFSDDDDDDLFGVKKKTEPRPQATRSTVVKEPQKTTEPVFDDPLSMLEAED